MRPQADELGEHFARIGAESFGDPDEFQDVDTTLAAFIARYKGLPLAQPLCQVLLREARALTRRRESFANRL